MPYWPFILILAAAYFFIVLQLFHITLKGNQIVSVISDFATAMQGFQDRQSAALVGIAGDVADLKKQIADLIAQGTLSAADLAALQGVEAKAQSVADSLEALDAETPPAPPVADGTVAG